MDNKITKKAETVYLIGRLWFLFVFVGTVIDTVCVALTSISIPISNNLSWTFLKNFYSISLYEGVPYLIIGALLSVIIAVPYLLFFIFSGKKLGWMKTGLAIYSVDLYFTLSTVLNNALIVGYIDGFHIAFDIISLSFHILGVVLISLGLKSSKRIDRFATVGSGRNNFGGNMYGQPFSTVRTLCLYRLNNGIGSNMEFNYHINGTKMGEIKPDETKIIMIDGNYQRLVITASGCLPVEVVIPAGRENSTYSLRAEYLSSAGLSLVIERTN